MQIPALRPRKPADGVAWVTGASSGIGRATALALARDGWTVHATARSAAALDDLAAEGGGRIVARPADVTDASAMAATVNAILSEGRPLALVLLNAGLYRPVDGRALAVDEFRSSVEVNLMGAVNGLVPAIAAMRGSGGGQIALVSSVAGYNGLPTSAAYGATKAGLINMAASLRFDLAGEGILVQVVNPGFVDTPATQQNRFAMPFLMSADEAARRLLAGLSKGRFEVAFPRRFALMLKAVGLLPWTVYFPLVRRITGWR